MRFVNTKGDRLAIEVIIPSGKTIDYVEPFGLTYEYSDRTVRDSRDLQRFVMKGILVEEGKEVPPEVRYAKEKESKPVVEDVGSQTPDQSTSITVEGSDFAGDESTIVSKAPEKDFAEEKTISQVAEEAGNKVADTLNKAVSNAPEVPAVGVPKDSSDASKIIAEAGQQGVVSNKEELLKKQPAKIKEAVDKGLVADTASGLMIPADVAKFNILPYFSKKAAISKETDKAFLGRMLACIKNDTIKALVRARLAELR